MGKARRMPFFEVVNAPASKPRVTLPLIRKPEPGSSAGSPAGGEGAGEPTTSGTPRPAVREAAVRESAARDASNHAGSHGASGRASAGMRHEASGTEAERERGAAPGEHEQPEEGGRILVLTTKTASVLLAAMVAVCIGVYLIGVRRGSPREALPAGAMVDPNTTPMDPPMPIEDPMRMRATSSGTMPILSGGGNSASVGGVRGGTTAGVSPEPSEAETGTGGVHGVDPRQAGNNYLILATLTFRDAEEAVQFLGRNGVRAAGVPEAVVKAGRKGKSGVDLASARAKNMNCIVFVLDGYSSSEYKARESERSRVEVEVRRLGKLWRKDHKGAADFSDAYWSKLRE